MVATQLSTYQGALRYLSEPRLDPVNGLTEDRNARYVLDDIWNDNLINYCLNQGLWLFATRAAQVDYNVNVVPPFGFKYAFDKPADYVRTAAFAQDEYFRVPVEYDDNAASWYADIQTAFVKYISSDAAYGANYANWPETFNKYVQMEMARLAHRAIVDSDPTPEFLKEFERMKLAALSTDAMNDSAKFPPEGKWARAHRGGRGNIRISSLPGTN